MKGKNMANKPNQKLKLLYLWKVLLEKTDDVNGVTTQEIIEELAYYGIDAERKGIYRDIDALRDFGYVIEQRGGKYWYLATRPMDLQEMIMLVDAVQSSPFLTEEMTDRLIGRIQQLASIDQRKLLQKRIEVPGRVKMDNESVLENLDVIQQAMRRKRKVEFTYFHYDIHKKKVPNKDGGIYRVTPVRLVYADEFYYLISFMDQWADVEGHQPFTPYRVDRMMDVRVSDEPATKDPRIATYVTEEHLSPSFGVFSADKVPVTLEFDQTVMNQIIDKFGLDALVFEKSNGRARAYVKAPLSPAFFGWVFQLGPYVKIMSPKRAVDEFAKMFNQGLFMYRNEMYRPLPDYLLERFKQEQFLQLAETLEAALIRKVAELPRGGFATETAFIDFAWEVIEEWRVEHRIDDGLPRRLPEERMKDGEPRVLPDPLRTAPYKAYGQIVGEAILAIEPRKWAAPDARESFLDTAKRYGQGRPFVFEPLMDWETREPSRKETGGDRKRVQHHGAVFEIWHEHGEKFWHCRFSSERAHMDCVDLEPWLGGETLPDATFAAAKYWQKIAYRFS